MSAVRVGSSSRAGVHSAGSESAELLAQFYREAWDSPSTTDEVRAARLREATENPGAFGKEAPTFLFLNDGIPHGHLSTIPARLWQGAREVPAHFMKGLWVLPAYRNGPIGFYLVREAAKHVDHAIALAVNPAATRLFEAAKFTDLGLMSNHVGMLRPARILEQLDASRLDLAGLNGARLERLLAVLRRTGVARLGGAAAGAGLRAFRRTAAPRTGLRYEACDALPPDHELGQLWLRMRTGVVSSQVRDAGYIHYRYGARGEDYRFVCVYRAGPGARELVGFSAVRRPRGQSDPRLNGLRVATLSEVVAAPADQPALHSVVAASEATALEMNADVLLCGATHRALRSILARRLYVGLPGNIHVLVRNSARDTSPPLSQWWLTRGDGESDETF